MTRRIRADAAFTAAYDQAKARTDAALDMLLDAIRGHTADADEASTAVIINMLLAKLTPGASRELLTAALIRLLHDRQTRR